MSEAEPTPREIVEAAELGTEFVLSYVGDPAAGVLRGPQILVTRTNNGIQQTGSPDGWDWLNWSRIESATPVA